jgi:hypothetical protein
MFGKKRWMSRIKGAVNGRRHVMHTAQQGVVESRQIDLLASATRPSLHQ